MAVKGLSDGYAKYSDSILFNKSGRTGGVVRNLETYFIPPMEDEIPIRVNGRGTQETAHHISRTKPEDNEHI